MLVSPGWLAVYGKEAQSGEEPMLAKVLPNEKVATEEIRVAANQTQPPARFTEATLLSAMEGAGKLIEDDELREAMREKGLGTPATRAQIIEGLIQEKYVLREGRELTPTAKAFSLMTLLHGLGVPELFSPELTAEWEFKLAQMEHGKLKRAAVHARDRAHDQAHRRPGEELRERYDSWRLRHALGALPEMRRRSAREVQEIPVPSRATSGCGRSLPDASSRSRRPRPCFASAASDRSRAFAASRAVPSQHA